MPRLNLVQELDTLINSMKMKTEKPFRYILKEGNPYIEGMPEMDKPEWSDYNTPGGHNWPEYNYDLEAYNKHIASLPCYKLSKLMPQWEGRTDIDPKEFEIMDSNKWYWCVCEQCGWQGGSEKLNGGGQIADTGDYGDAYCPKCDSTKIEMEDDITAYAGTIAIPLESSLNNTGEEEKERGWTIDPPLQPERKIIN